MATTARQQYFADESSLSKEKREFSIANEIQEKIDSIEEWAQVNKIEAIKVNWTAVTPDANKTINLAIPRVEDSLSSISTIDALSARQWKILYDYIQDVSHIWHFLALWDASTWLPVTNPEVSPYIYNTWDFYTVSNVAPSWGTNYRPDGTQYVIWQASTTVDTDDVEVNDFYFYDGATWRHMKNSWAGSIAIDGSLSTTSTNPVENRVITNAINWKQNTLIAWTNIQIAADWKTISATDTTYSAWANISIDANNEISATDTTYTAWANVQISNQNVISATDTKYTAWTWINIDANNVISNTQTSAEWWNITWTLSDQTDLQTVLNAKQDDMVILKYWISTWNDFITAYNKNWVIYCRASSNSDPASWSQTRLAFMAYVNNETTPTEVEFQYYRSRSSHSTAATALDEVYVYKLVSTNGWTWTVTQRDTAAKPLAWTWIWLTYNASGMTISADTTVLATKTDLNSKQDTISDLATIRSWASAGATALQPWDNVSELTNDSWYITSSYHDSSKQDVLTAGTGIDITWTTISATNNTKTFYISSTSDLTNAQSAINWYLAGGNPIVMYWTWTWKKTFILTYIYNDTSFIFTTTDNKTNDTSTSTIYFYRLRLSANSWTVTNIYYENYSPKYLDTSYNYWVPYTPLYNGSPATKKYVDDAIAWVWWWIEVDENSPIQLTKIRAGTESDYQNLGSYDQNTVYLTI